ncbi:MAG TPA: hypothetical protein ENG70_00445 [Candidatus Cloacimonetes bacterium]|nr:hypothetical protein [Candidatus Cloacimonadota bacterium]HEX37324.1 hypothetical protein [Candidatus Cloacimonadota bacterium]
MHNLRFILVLTLTILVGSAALFGNRDLISPQLQHKLIETKSDDLIPIIIIMKDQYDPQVLLDQSVYLPRNEKRSHVIEELKSFAEFHQQDIVGSLNSYMHSDLVKDLNPLWISNVVACKAKHEVIYDLAHRDDITLIDHDEMRKMISFEKTKTFDPTTREITWNVIKVNADDVWALGHTGDGVVVSVIDTGVNYNHVDLADHLWTDPGYPYH